MNELEQGILRLHWAEDHMPVMQAIRKRFIDEKPLKGLKIGMALHTEAKTGILAIALSEAGADIRLASCNPLSTDNSVARALKEEYGLNVYAKKGETPEEYCTNLNSVLNMGPDYVIDDGADLIARLHTTRKDVLKNVKGANEETTTGVLRVNSMEEDGTLQFPVMAVNDAKMKYLFDNRYGTGQSAFEGWMVATNLIVAGKNLVVGGYGWCGKGVAMRAKGLGAIVTVTEVDPIKAIEAVMDGFRVEKMSEAVKSADIVLTVTGCNDVLSERDFKNMKNGCVMGNVGHFDNEININDLRRMSTSSRKVREHIMEYTMQDGRRLNVISDGRLMNLAAGQGHPAEIMDMSFAVQALSIEYLVKNHKEMENKVYTIPPEMDRAIAETKLTMMGIVTDTLTDSQLEYLRGWEAGTE